MLHVITPSLLVVSSQPSTENIGSIYLDLNEDMGMSSGNLSSTLKKLHMWEKKLYDEVKVCFMVDLLPFFVTFSPSYFLIHVMSLELLGE